MLKIALKSGRRLNIKDFKIQVSSLYTDIRTKYLGHQAWPTLNKFNALMSTKNCNLLYKISKHITEAFEIRTNALKLIT